MATGTARVAALVPSMVTTAFDLPGHRIVRNVGVVRGITVRSRSVLGNVAGGLQAVFGGNISAFTKMCEQARAWLHICE